MALFKIVGSALLSLSACLVFSSARAQDVLFQVSWTPGLASSSGGAPVGRFAQNVSGTLEASSTNDGLGDYKIQSYNLDLTYSDGTQGVIDQLGGSGIIRVPPADFLGFGPSGYGYTTNFQVVDFNAGYALSADASFEPGPGLYLDSDSRGNISFANGNKLTFFAPSLVAAAPEPSTWLLMVLGFGLVGVALRSRVRTRVAVAA